MLLLLLAALVFVTAQPSAPAPSPATTCATSCADGVCPQVDNVAVGSLCAQSICINGNPVPTSDGNPCTLDDVIVDSAGAQTAVHLPIPNCCRVDGDCAQFAAPCQMAGTCTIATGQSYGWCAFEQIVDCCSTSSELPGAALQDCLVRLVDVCEQRWHLL